MTGLFSMISSFTFDTFKYMLLLILLYFYLRNIFNAGLLLVTEYSMVFIDYNILLLFRICQKMSWYFVLQTA